MQPVELEEPQALQQMPAPQPTSTAQNLSTGSAILFSALLASGLTLRVALPLRWFSWHPFLMLLGFISFACAGIAAKTKGGRTNTLNHGYLMCFATACCLGGWYVIHEQKNMLGKPHITTWHAYFGLAVIILYTLGAAGGLAALHPDFGVARTSQDFRRVHKWSGRFATFLSFVALATGWVKLSSNLETVLLVGLLALLSWAVLLPPAWRMGTTASAAI
jgi:hypothetical protein